MNASSRIQAFRASPLFQALLLGVFALVTAALLSMGNQTTRGEIEKRRQEDLMASLVQVIPHEMHDNDLLADTLSLAGPDGAPVTIYRARKGGAIVAAAYLVTGHGYGGDISLIMGVDLSGKVFLGTGQWTSADLSDPAFKGALYADLDQSGFGSFKERYKQAYGKAPTLNAGIGYDAVALVAGIVKQRGAGGLNQAALESPTGFIGTTGVFRFNRDGTTDRALAVYRVGASGTEIASPAPKRFGFRGS